MTEKRNERLTVSHWRAFKDAREKVIGLGTLPAGTERYQPPLELSSYFFTLQGDIEKREGMNYHSYATDMWRKLMPDADITSPGFKQFEHGMITGLNAIEMSPLVYPDVLEAIPELIDRYKDKIDGVALWSTGDVQTTGYQVAKINRSRIINSFRLALRKKMNTGDRSRFVREKTRFLVDDDKFALLREYVVDQIESAGPDKKVKIVIIEDSSGNFGKATDNLQPYIKAEQVEVVPIWFTGSREGIQAQETADAKERKGDTSERVNLDKKKEDLNAIGSFRELLDGKRFGTLFKDAHVFVDFDGVICDNVEMRVRQAEAIYTALMAGAQIETGLGVEELSSRFLDQLKQTATV